MTPAARVAAAIDILDRIATGEPAERALTNWARGARYAGSKDRAAIRDHVFTVLRRWRSTAVRGGGTSGRQRMLGLLRDMGVDPSGLFTGEGHAPSPLTDAEATSGTNPTGQDALDVQDWCYPLLHESLGATCDETLLALRDRAALHVRVHPGRLSREKAIEDLTSRGIAAEAHPLDPLALEIGEGARRVNSDPLYVSGAIEIQDAASQAVARAVPLAPGDRVLDFCAGGGGKTLAMAAREPGATFEAHDASPDRMRDLPIRAKRAGVAVTLHKAHRDLSPGSYDVVVADVPCSGSGAWRRQPEAKWRLTPDRLAELNTIQDDILDRCADLTAPDGVLVYMTCSLLKQENIDRIDAFCARNPQWHLKDTAFFSPLRRSDGLFFAAITRQS